jgi:hypothetical protein
MDTAARLTMLTRAGFAARGLLYVVIGLLVITAGRAEDPSGALDYLAHGAGKPLLVVIIAGFLGYGLWRLSDAAFNIERHDRDAEGVLERVGAAGSGLVHLFLAWQAVRLVQGSSAGGGNSAAAIQGDETKLILAALVLLAVGAFQIVKAVRASFCKGLDAGVADKNWVKLSGRLGYGARGLVFLIAGYFMLRAGIGHRGGEPATMDRVLAWLDSPWDVAVAAGLLMFGIFCFIEARYRRVHPLPIGGMAEQVRSKLRA